MINNQTKSNFIHLSFKGDVIPFSIDGPTFVRSTLLEVIQNVLTWFSMLITLPSEEQRPRAIENFTTNQHSNSRDKIVGYHNENTPSSIYRTNHVKNSS